MNPRNAPFRHERGERTDCQAIPCVFSASLHSVILSDVLLIVASALP